MTGRFVSGRATGWLKAHCMRMARLVGSLGVEYAGKAVAAAGDGPSPCSRPEGWTDEAIGEVARHMGDNYEALEFLRLSQFGAWGTIREEYPQEAKRLDDAAGIPAPGRSITVGGPHSQGKMRSSMKEIPD